MDKSQSKAKVQDNNMKVIRTPEIHYFEAGQVEFSTSRKDGELYYTIKRWNTDRTVLITTHHSKVKDKTHLDELHSMENAQN